MAVKVTDEPSQVEPETELESDTVGDGFTLTATELVPVILPATPFAVMAVSV